VRSLDVGPSRSREFAGKAISAAALSGDKFLARYASETAS
jgi:hypothetical protein